MATDPQRTGPHHDAVMIADIEAAALCSIARATLHRLRSSGKWGPRAVRLGRCLRFARAEVIAWLEAGAPDARTWAAIRDAQARRVAREKD